MTIQKESHFSGSYSPSDIEFLLTPVEIEMTPVEEKELLIQSGQKHYSDMLSQEPAPTEQHLELFHKALDIEGPRLAREVVMLAKGLATELRDKAIVLVSLVRAGVPLGVMLQRALQDMGVESHHYGISIIRDRGIDTEALNYIERRHGAENIVFVDGWTGKGAITGQLIQSLAGRPDYPESPRLVVLADPAGCAWLAASDDDWLIPFGIMGAPVSGLVSRSIWTEQGYHGCVHCDHLKEFECSVMLVDAVDAWRRRINVAEIKPASPLVTQQAEQRKRSQQVIANLAAQFEISSINRIKPGIAEATRAVLRRVPDYVLVRHKSDPDVSLLVYLAEKKGIEIMEVGDALDQYRAVTIIKKVA